MENQDRSVVLSDKSKGLMAIVADGLGGHSGGSLAASEVCNTAEVIWNKTRNIDDEESFLRSLVLEMHESVRYLNKRGNLNSRSTVAIILITKNVKMAVHVGDSRVLQYSAKFSHSLQLSSVRFEGRTYDHTVAQMKLSMKKITQEQYGKIKAKSQLLTVLGGKEPPEPEITPFKFIPSVFIVCSDGFWEFLDNIQQHELLNILNDEIKLKQFISQNVDKNESCDNSTSIVIKDNCHFDVR